MPRSFHQEHQRNNDSEDKSQIPKKINESDHGRLSLHRSGERDIGGSTGGSEIEASSDEGASYLIQQHADVRVEAAR